MDHSCESHKYRKFNENAPSSTLRNNSTFFRPCNKVKSDSRVPKGGKAEPEWIKLSWLVMETTEFCHNFWDLPVKPWQIRKLKRMISGLRLKIKPELQFQGESMYILINKEICSKTTSFSANKVVTTIPHLYLSLPWQILGSHFGIKLSFSKSFGEQSVT